MQTGRGLRSSVGLSLGLAAILVAGILPPTAGRTQAAVLVGAGDIARCSSDRDEATAALIADISGTVFTAGDNAYPDGTARQFDRCYDPSWGAFLRRTRPSPGNHDYDTPGASGYFGYFGDNAGPGSRGFYAYRRGAWRIYSLNSERITNRQIDWLEADLAAHPSQCSLAYWHRPRFSSGHHGNDRQVRAFWVRLYDAGVELVVNGHDHDYERFAPMRPNGTRHWKGIRQFVVGTGGTGLRPFEEVQAHSVVRQASVHGVLKLVLGDGRYRWRFISVDGSWSDSGSARCHGRP